MASVSDANSLVSFPTKLDPIKSDKEIRASALRALRYFLNTVEDVILFTELKLPTLIIRILDTNYDESAYDDRVQALKERVEIFKKYYLKHET